MDHHVHTEWVQSQAVTSHLSMALQDPTAPPATSGLCSRVIPSSSLRGVALALQLKSSLCSQHGGRGQGCRGTHPPLSLPPPVAGASGQMLALGEGSLTSCSHTLIPKCQWDKSRPSRGTSSRSQPLLTPIIPEHCVWDPELHPCWKLVGHC